MKFAVRVIVCGVLLSMCSAPAMAQYMKITTNNPSDNTKMNASGPTLLTITLDTNHDRNGSTQTCNSHTNAAGCGAPTTSQPLDMFAYTISLVAVGGTVQWSTFTAADAAYTIVGTDPSDNTSIEVNRARPAGSVTPAGLVTLGTITVTPLSGSPAINISNTGVSANPAGFGTGFGTPCDGFNFLNTYVLGNSADVCNTGDWFDADGAAAAVGNTAPNLVQPSNMTVAEGATADQTLTATDSEGNPITFSLVSGPTYASVTTTTPGTGTGTGNLHLAPGFFDQGAATAIVRASDGSATTDRSVSITVTNVNRPPVLNQPNNMFVAEGATADQVITGTDPDLEPLTFSLVSGPTYVTVTTVTPGTGTGTGNIRLSPGFFDSGPGTATVQVSDGAATNQKTFTINVTNTNRPPTLNQPSDMTVTAGSTADQTITATDPDLQPLTFSLQSGPSYVTVTTTTPGSGTATGNIHLAPGAADAGTATATVRVTDGTANNDKSFSITVSPGTPTNNAPVLVPPSNMTVAEGGTASQTLTATDVDGNPLSFSKAAGPTFMDVTTVTAGTGTGTGNVTLAPSTGDAGTYTGTVRVSDGSATDEESFTITVVAPPPGNNAPVLVPPSNMTVAEGATQDQAVTATDADGDALSFTKASGPGFMAVTTTTAGTGTGTGNIHLAPGFSDAGTYTGTVQASDGSATDAESFTITVTNTNRAPTLNPIANMTVTEGATQDQAITGTDPDGDPLTFSKVTGPTFVTITTTDQGTGTGTGNVHVAPNTGDASGIGYTVQARVSDGTAEDTRIFSVVVVAPTPGNNAPVLQPPSDMTVAEGATLDQAVTATDVDGNPLSFTKAAGPGFMTVTTTTAGTGTGTGNINLAPGFSDAGTYTGTVRVSDGSATDEESFTITVTNTNRAPVLQQPSDMTVTEGSTQDQTVTATDADGDALSFTKASGPTFMTVTTITGGTGTGTGNIHLAPSTGDAGTHSGTVQVSDGTANDQKSLTITVVAPAPGNNAPVLQAISNMTVDEGATQDQAVTATDVDGNPLSFTKASGPGFMTVTTVTGGTGTGTGNIHLAPGFADAGTYSASVRVSDGSATDEESFTITVNNVSTGAQEAVGSLTGGDRLIRLNNPRPFWCVRIKPATPGSFDVRDIIVSSVEATYGGASISALEKAQVLELDEDGLLALRVCFSKTDLRTLFASLPNGLNHVEVQITGDLEGGGSFEANVAVDVMKGGENPGDKGKKVDAFASPNPFNPSTTIHYELSRPGSVNLRIYNVAGRLVNTLIDGFMGAGPHSVAWNGTARDGSRVSSGVYYFVLQTPEGMVKRHLVVAK